MPTPIQEIFKKDPRNKNRPSPFPDNPFILKVLIQTTFAPKSRMHPKAIAAAVSAFHSPSVVHAIPVISVISAVDCD